MKMRIHGFPFVGILFAQAHVGYFLPVTGGCFTVAILHGVETMCLDVTEEPDGVVQGFFIAGGSMVFAQSVDGESEGIDLFFGVGRNTIVLQRPIDASVFLVEEIIDNHSLGTGCYLKVVLAAEQSVGC